MPGRRELAGRQEVAGRREVAERWELAGRPELHTREVEIDFMKIAKNHESEVLPTHNIDLVIF